MAASRDNSLRVEAVKKYTNRGSCYSSMESDEDELNNSSLKEHYLDLPDTAAGRPRTESGVSVSSHGRSSSRDESIILGTSPTRLSPTRLSPGRRQTEMHNIIMGTSEENDEENDEEVENDEGVVVDQTKLVNCKPITETEVDQKLRELEINMKLEYSFKLSRSLTALTYFNKDDCLISGSFGMVHIWDASKNVIKISLPVAGEVVSLDSWKDCLAVGSEVIQIIQLTGSQKKPKRTIYAKKGELMLQTKDAKYLVTFAGNEGYLASAKVGGSTIDIWSPPPVKCFVVTKPLLNMQVEGSIISMTASKDPDYPLLAVVASVTDGGQPHETLNLLNCSCRESNAPQIQITFTAATSSAFCKIFSSFLPTGRSIAIGNGRELSITKCGEYGKPLNVKLLEHKVTYLNCESDPESQQGIIAVGTDDGNAYLYDTERLHELCKIPIKQNASIMYVSQNETSLLFVSCESTLQIWNNQPNDEIEPPRYCVGMELCSEGVLSQRRMLPITESQSLNLLFEEHDVHLELPQEVLQEKSSLEVAFAPYNNAGPFEFPEGVIPVSPLVWFCLHPQKEFTNAASIKLPICFECKSKEDAKLLFFLKAEHNDITINEDGQTVIKFNPVDQKKSQFQPNSPYGVLKDHHFCIYCVGFSSLQESVLKKVRYCLTIQKPIAFPKDELKKDIYCIVHYNLPGCRELVKRQTPEDYVVHTETPVQFDNLEAALELTVDVAEAEVKGWMITVTSKKLFTNEVNFFTQYELGILEDDCNKSRYPPRMVVEVSSREALFQSLIKLTFTGAKRGYSTEIALFFPLNEEHLHALDHERQDQGCGPADRQPRPFLGQPNTPS